MGGLIFSKMVRISTRKAELRGKSRSHRPKIGDMALKSEPKRPESAPEQGFGLSTEKGLKAFLNPANLDSLLKEVRVFKVLHGRKAELVQRPRS